MRLSTSLAIVISAGILLPLLAVAQTPIWADEFDGTTLDPANWEIMIGDGTNYGVPGWGNNELEYYTGRTENLLVSGGYLNIIAREEDYAGHDYTSARIRSLNLQEFLYGRLEARIKLPTGQGIWPAFWMLPTNSPYGGWAASGEIDIMECINEANRVYGTIHYGGGWPNNVNSGGSFADGTDFSAGFHVYSIEWDLDEIRWYVDNVHYHTESSATWYSDAAPANDRAPFDVPFHFLLNVAVGGNWPGYPDGTAQFPQVMQVDWVRVYNEFGAQMPYYGTPQFIPGTVEAEDFDIGSDSVAYHDCDVNNQGGDYRSEGVDIEESSEHGYNIGWMCAGEWTEYSVNVAAAGVYTLETRVASDATGGEFHVEFNGVDRTGTLLIPVTGGWQAWQTVSTPVVLPAGEQVMRFVNDSTSDEYNLNYFRFLYVGPLPGDIDADGDADFADFERFSACLAGPEVTTPPAGCTPDEFDRSDMEDDGDVDLWDFALFQQVFGS